MKITLEPRKTTWVPFIDTDATLEIHWTARIEYTPHAAHQDASHAVDMRYSFSGMQGAQFIPSSQLIIKESGIPLTITESVVSPIKDRFKSERVADPFVEISDKVASIGKSKVSSRQLSKRMIERSWTEKICRSIKLQNRTGKQVSLQLTLVDRPAEELVFVASAPDPSRVETPEYAYDVELEPDAVQVIKLELKLRNVEKLELPPEQPQPRQERAHETETIQQANMPAFEEIEYQQEFVEQALEEDDQ